MDYLIKVDRSALCAQASYGELSSLRPEGLHAPTAATHSRLPAADHVIAQ